MKRHGMSQTKIYRTYMRIKNRCENKNDTRNYKKYGAKGIKCLWDSFQEFQRDMQKSFDKHVKQHGERDTTIDRIDSTGNYCKENCRWATYKVQSDNRKVLHNAVLIEIDGVKKPRSTWVREAGMNQSTFCTRYYELGWTAKDALLTPVKQIKPRANIKYKGETPVEASRRLGLHRGGVARRIREGWSIKDAFTIKTPIKHYEHNFTTTGADAKAIYRRV